MKFAQDSDKDGGVTVLAVSGEVDVATSPLLRTRIGHLIAPGEHLIIDLRGVQFMDSTGLGVLVAGRNRAMETGACLSLVCDQAKLLTLFTMTGLADVFTIYATRPDAVAAAVAAPDLPA